MAPQNEPITAAQVARIAAYDDLLSAPRMVEIPPSDIATYIDKIAATTYELACQQGGFIPYTVIREVSENFIHAQFKEITVSILDHGCTIRFADQGPGIDNKDRAQLPGFSSATSEMKEYIRGVGSGLPMVKEYLKFSNGRLVIEDNIQDGAVVTIAVDRNAQNQGPVVYQESPAVSLPVQQAQYAQTSPQMMGAYGHVPQNSAYQTQQTPMPSPATQPAWGAAVNLPQQAASAYQQPQMQGNSAAASAYNAAAMQPAAGIGILGDGEADILALATEGSIGPTDVSRALGASVTTAYRKLDKLEEQGMLMQDASHKGKRILTQLGLQVLRGQE